MFKISNVYKALLILPEECKHPNLVLNLSSTKFSTKSKFSTIDSTKFSTAVYTTPFGACVRALWVPGTVCNPGARYPYTPSTGGESKRRRGETVRVPRTSVLAGPRRPCEWRRLRSCLLGPRPRRSDCVPQAPVFACAPRSAARWLAVWRH